MSAPSSARARVDAAKVREVAGDVPDPEIPVLTIADLGILRAVDVSPGGHVRVEITPTYSGCPAIDAIRADVVERLRKHGWHDAEVALVLSPAWTTDWITAEGRRKLREYGVAPPGPATGASTGPVLVPLTLPVRCPRCDSPHTRELSRFGSTACKSLWACADCLEPFDHFKAL